MSFRRCSKSVFESQESKFPLKNKELPVLLIRMQKRYSNKLKNFRTMAQDDNINMERLS